jgi:hypothetical protein
MSNAATAMFTKVHDVFLSLLSINLRLTGGNTSRPRLLDARVAHPAAIFFRRASEAARDA